jgi:hypothetical protein
MTLARNFTCALNREQQERSRLHFLSILRANSVHAESFLLLHEWRHSFLDSLIIKIWTKLLDLRVVTTVTTWQWDRDKMGTMITMEPWKGNRDNGLVTTREPWRQWDHDNKGTMTTMGSWQRNRDNGLVTTIEPWCQYDSDNKGTMTMVSSIR